MRKLSIALVLLLALKLGAAATPFEEACDSLAVKQGDDAQRLHELFKLDWDYRMHEDPEEATEVGYPGQNARWQDRSLAAIERRKQELRAPLKVLESIEREKLSATDRLNYDLFNRNQRDALEATRFGFEFIALSQLHGPQQELANVLDLAPKANVKDFEDILARLESVPIVLEQTRVLLEKGLEKGITEPQIILRDVPQQIKNQMPDDLSKSPFLKVFAEFPAEIPHAEQERLRQAGEQVVREKVNPAFATFHEFFAKKYLPHTRENIACADLPDGAAWYAHNVRIRTTTSLNPQQIHELGLSEVKRIHQEMDKVIAQTGFKGDFAKFSRFLRTDKQFF